MSRCCGGVDHRDGVGRLIRDVGEGTVGGDRNATTGEIQRYGPVTVLLAVSITETLLESLFTT